MSINKEIFNMGIIEDMKKEVKKEMKEQENDRGILDIITAKAISRKLLVWVTACVFLGLGKITPDEWTAISLGYVGVEGFADLASKWKFGK
jgi:hypothetical protein